MPLSELLPVLLAWALAISSPGPATLAITGTAMEAGRAHGLALAGGVVLGSAFWALVAGMGLGAAMMSHAWAVELLRYAGAGYLAWLAFRSARAALRPGAAQARGVGAESLRHAFGRGALIHLTNPKAVLFWGSIFAIVIPAGAPAWVLWEVGIACFLTSALVLTLMALAFSSRPVAAGYLRARRVFDAAFAVLFGLAALKVLTTRFA